VAGRFLAGHLPSQGHSAAVLVSGFWEWYVARALGPAGQARCAGSLAGCLAAGESGPWPGIQDVLPGPAGPPLSDVGLGHLGNTGRGHLPPDVPSAARAGAGIAPVVPSALAVRLESDGGCEWEWKVS
jgi:hypothetical protein